MTPLAIPSPNSTERARLLSVNALRLEKLSFLYQRRDTVDQLIQSLEEYMRCKQARGPECVDFISAARKCS